VGLFGGNKIGNLIILLPLVVLVSHFGFTKQSSGQCLLNGGTFSVHKYWPEHGLIKQNMQPKLCIIDCILMLG
jgi:hypothetical protein